MYHKELADGKWAAMPFSVQMANIGSEVFRASKWKEKNRKEQADIAFERALELIDLSLKTASRPTILKELCRVREMLCIAYYEQSAAEFNTFNPYFFAFALLNNNK